MTAIAGGGNFGRPGARRVASAGADSLKAGQFAAGSMGPKVEAAIAFATATGHSAANGRLEDAIAILRSEAGTRIDPGNAEVSLR